MNSQNSKPARSDKQIEASRRNGAKSKGPKTQAGKMRSALNALKHGFRAAQENVTRTDKDDYFDFQVRLLGEITPLGASEEKLADQYVFACYQLERIAFIEAHGNVREPGQGLFGSLVVLARYRSSLERTRDRALKQLKELQTERCLRDAPYSRRAKDIPMLASSQAYRRRIQEYDFDHKLDPHSPRVWPRREQDMPAAVRDKPIEPEPAPAPAPQLAPPQPQSTASIEEIEPAVPDFPELVPPVSPQITQFRPPSPILEV